MFINTCILMNKTGTYIYIPHCYKLRRFTLPCTNRNQQVVLLSRQQDFSFKWVFLWQHYSSDNVLSVLIQQLPVARRPRRNKYFILPPSPAIINTLLLLPSFFFTPFPFRLPSLLLFPVHSDVYSGQHKLCTLLISTLAFAVLTQICIEMEL